MNIQCWYCNNSIPEWEQAGGFIITPQSIQDIFNKGWFPIGAFAECEACNVSYSAHIFPGNQMRLTSISIYIKFPVYIELNLLQNDTRMMGSLIKPLAYNLDMIYFLTNDLDKIRSRMLKLIPFI